MSIMFQQNKRFTNKIIFVMFIWVKFYRRAILRSAIGSADGKIRNFARE